MKKYTIITLYPELLKPYTEGAVLGRAQKTKKIAIDFVNLRHFGLGRYKQVDDTPYGGGPGMILRADVVVPAIKQTLGQSKEKTKVVLLTPKGQSFSQKTAVSLTNETHIIFVCGRFEGFDERITKYIDEKISVGPYVLAGGELPALTIIEAVTRLLPGVLGNADSTAEESFNSSTLEYPQYTKPEKFEQRRVPSVLLSGHHQEIKKWRQQHLTQI
jgi:tRNA (guanine37-N1)-methyltransferase